MKFASFHTAARMFAIVSVLTCRPAVAGQDANAILVLHTYGQEAPGRVPFDAALSRVFRQTQEGTSHLYIESLDAVRFGSSKAAVRAYLKEKYKHTQLSVVVAVYDPALSFVLDPADPLFPGVPVVALLSARPPADLDRVTVVWSGNTRGASAALAVRLRPQTKSIVVVDGSLENGGVDAARAETLQQIADAGLNVAVSFIHDTVLEDVLDKVRSLPPDAAVLITRLTIRSGGQPITNDQAVAAIGRAATVPVYTISDQLIGSGALGGVVASLEKQGNELAELAIRVAGGARPVSQVESVPIALFDWRELKRWGVPESSLPPGSVVRFRQLTFWDQYWGYAVGVATILLLQAALIAGLFTQRVRRRRTENALRQSYDQNRDLAGRLINAQEEERTRIARDLHDDVSQQLAGLSIMMSALRRKAARPDAQGNIAEEMTMLQDRTSELASSIRNLSHELHPGVLQHAGIVAALQRHCADVARYQPIELLCSDGAAFGSLRPDIALCLFRVAQEAIANAVRHAQARTIRVRLSQRNGLIDLGIVDDGVGFMVSERTGRGLGLRSIDERVRLVGGHFTVDSRPGSGTTLAVRIPTEPT